MTGQEFRDLRKSMKLSQEKLGEILEVQKRTIINQEKSETVPPVYEYAIRFLAIRSQKEPLQKMTSELLNLF